MTSLRRRWDEMRLAVMLLTRIPVGRIEADIPLARAAWAYPFVGLPIGGCVGLVFAGALWVGAAPGLAAVLALAASALLTGALHHDGFADFADALGARTRARKLEIMRDSRIGAYGVIALGLALAAIGTALADLGAAASPAVFLGFAVASRLAMLGALVFLPNARDDGLGRAAQGGTPRSLAAGGLLTTLAILPLGHEVLLAASAGALAALALAAYANRALGGQTGDVLGAVQLSFETVAWVTLSLLVVSP